MLELGCEPLASQGNPPGMVADPEKSSDKKLFKFSDLILTCCFVLLGIFITYAVISLLGIGEFPTFPKQFLGP
jgi:hypothetical protein